MSPNLQGRNPLTLSKVGLEQVYTIPMGPEWLTSGQDPWLPPLHPGPPRSQLRLSGPPNALSGPPHPPIGADVVNSYHGNYPQYGFNTL